MRRTTTLAAALALAAPSATLAAGGHDSVGCTGCHSLHAAQAGELIFALSPNAKALNPKTKEPYGGTSALCLACHADASQGGKGYAPVSGHLSHPFALPSVNPRLARVPDDLLRGGRFECVACHDPHPSNPNASYLRVSFGDKPSIGTFCGVCHPRQADPTARKPAIFSSMDESAGRPAAPAPDAPAARTRTPARRAK